MTGDPSQAHVSVVTPVHNGEEYLDACIRSVVEQTHHNWDYTIVNNGSTDRSLEIARAWAERDERIRVIDNEEFLEQIPNLNRAFAAIHPESDYAKMLLADDWMFPQCLDEMVTVAERHPNVGIVSAYRLEDTRVTLDGLPYPSPIVSGREICRRSLLTDFFVFGSPSNLLYRSEVVRERQPFYDPGALHEDTESCYEILERHDLGFVHQVLTFTRRQNESLTNERNQFDSAHRLDKFIIVSKFGEIFLGEEEYLAALERARGAYYRYLGERNLYTTDRAFWEYHRRGLATAGLELDRVAVRKATLEAGWRQLGSPRQVIRRSGRLVMKALQLSFTRGRSNR